MGRTAAEALRAGSVEVAANVLSGIRRIAAEAWAFRWQVEREAEVRFARLGRQLSEIGAPELLVALAHRSSADERRHAVLCFDLAREYGYEGNQAGEVLVGEIAPKGLSTRQKVLYELVATCCITETESMSVLTTLLRAARARRMKQVLQEIARDEVSHSKLGWAHLAHEQAEGDVRFLGPLIPDMLEGTVSESFFQGAAEELENPELLQHGVLPHSTKQSIFIQTLKGIVFPGLDSLGVDSAPGRKWLERRTLA